MVKKLASPVLALAVVCLWLPAPTFAGFGFRSFDGSISNQDGSPDTQAGSHPYQISTSFTFNTKLDPQGRQIPDGDVKNAHVDLPPGFIGDATAVSTCTDHEFFANVIQGNVLCPAATQVGVATVTIAALSEDGVDDEPVEVPSPVYNLVPGAGVPAEFGFYALGVPITLDARVRTGGDNGVTVVSKNDLTQSLEIYGVALTFWGVPADPSHDPQRNCAGQGIGVKGCSSEAALIPFLTLPTSCAGPQKTTITAESWQEPAVPAERFFVSHDNQGNPIGVDGCDRLPFSPVFSAKPDTSAADAPAGLTFDLKMPQDGLLSPGGVTSADLKDTTVTLPEGVAINPGQAAGLQACQSNQDGGGTEEPPSCPAASKVGTVEVTTPLLPDKLEGDVYVLQSNPPNLKLLVAASADGVNLKLVGNVHLNATTGQLTTTFSETPQLPFTDFKLNFSGGAQAALVTPPSCGTYTTTADFTPWSTPFESDVLDTNSFAVTSGPGGSACPPSPLPFSPSMTAGSTTDQAGSFTNFSLLLQREDGQQRIEKLQFKEPAGLAGLIASVPLCDEADADAGTCPAASHLGHAVVTSGPGPYPLVLPQPGDPELPIYLTGPYKGAPFGLSIVTPIVAGPFNLGTVITRAKIEIDPRTAQITITTDPLPQIVDGVPTDLRSINAIIDRPKFLFNPTSCDSQEFSGTGWGTPPPGASGPGATAPLASHFGVGSCRSLTYKPSLSVSTGARTSRANGASLSFKIGYPKGAMGSQSWFREAKFDLPKQLPSRLTTLQKACLAATFEHNRGACPAASQIGSASVSTPVLANKLTGTVYFVSYGGAQFPEAVIVLHGEGITIELHGETFINSKGITSATFRSLPDVPFNTIEVTLPTGKYSEFAGYLPAKAKDSFCGQKLTMPTRLVAQNGLEIKQTTAITVTGCRKPHKVKKARHARRAKRSRHGPRS